MRNLAIAAILVAAAVQVVFAGAAQAHATLVSSEPADGAVIAAAPSRLTLTFNEPVAPLALRLVAPNDTSTVVQATAERETSLVITWPSRLSNGTHVLSWRVVSLDGHPIGGTVVFSVGAPTASPSAAAQNSAQPIVSAALWAFKIVFYVGAVHGDRWQLLSCLACSGSSRRRANDDHSLLADGACRDGGAGRTTRRRRIRAAAIRVG